MPHHGAKDHRSWWSPMKSVCRKWFGLAWSGDSCILSNHIDCNNSRPPCCWYCTFAAILQELDSLSIILRAQASQSALNDQQNTDSNTAGGTEPTTQIIFGDSQILGQTQSVSKSSDSKTQDAKHNAESNDSLAKQHRISLKEVNPCYTYKQQGTLQTHETQLKKELDDLIQIIMTILQKVLVWLNSYQKSLRQTDPLRI